MIRKQLRQACEQGEIRPLDFHIGLFLEQQAGREEERNSRGNSDTSGLLLAATLAAAAVGNGHVCLPLNEAADILTSQEITFPEVKKWREVLLASPVVGQPGEVCPLILDERNRLYLYRFYCYEKLITEELRKRAVNNVNNYGFGGVELDQQKARQLLKQLFPQSKENSGSGINFQQIAAALALLKPLLIISGGPGTGKTYTVARILALMHALHKKKKSFRIALAAPTGKAAARLEESIRKAKLSLPDALSRNIPEQAQTLHRLLGSRPGADDFRYNRDNLLHIDLLVLDEASMIDVVLMTGLLQALPPTTRIILLGDRDQLASVEAGSLFADLCGGGEVIWSSQLCKRLEDLTGASGLPSVASVDAVTDSLVVLRTSYRFQDNSGIGSLAAAVKCESMEKVDKVFAADFADLRVAHCTGGKREEWLRKRIRKVFEDMMLAQSLEQGFAAMEKFRFLCALRKGPAGVEGINSLVSQVLRQAGFISSRNTDWYKGKPIIILRNQYEMQLFNGDTGILWPGEDGKLRAWFRHPDNSFYAVSPARLPEHETAYAVTVHKAQGSEFDQVLLLLPEEDSKVLTRELIYTGITRARNGLVLCSGRDILATAVRRRTGRYSGLGEKLRSEKTIG